MIFKIPVYWSVSGIAEIEADDIESAIDTSKEDMEVPLPEDSYYIDGSWEVNEDMDMINYLNGIENTEENEEE